MFASTTRLLGRENDLQGAKTNGFLFCPRSDTDIRRLDSSVYSGTGAVVAKHGGKYLARTASHESLEGDREAPALRVIIEWPSKDAAHAFMKDPDYAAHLAARSNGSVSHHTLVEATDDLA